jgi:BirA family biotin operon repressor/biotin-[acetyl-CoA-carboxylase] ligase
LGLLRERSGFVPGAELSEALGMTRAALSRKVESLRQGGFPIEARRGRGYRLLKARKLSAGKIKALVTGDLGSEIVFLERTSSTNDIAMDLARAGSPHGTVVIADAQLKGRGRRGRRWASPPGKNIYLSVVLRPRLHPRHCTVLTLAAATAAADALRAQTGAEVTIKWPNDLVASGKKIGGILLETRSEPGGVLYAVLGVGINVNSHPEDFPPEVLPLATSVLMETGRRHRRGPLIASILTALEDALIGLEKASVRAALIERFKGLCFTLGRQVRVVVEGEVLSGLALDVDPCGRLILRGADGSLSTISAGDLELLRPGGFRAKNYV